MDYLLGERTGLEVFRAIRKLGCDQPVVMLTGKGSEQVAVEAMKAGVTDYVVKSAMSATALHHTVTNALAKFDLQRLVREQQERLTQKVQELQEALALINTLHGILPICSFCKKIRNDKGAWDQIEKYISEHSEAVFSHSLCPDCAKEKYPNFTR